MRINKFIAQSGYTSRRKADQLIKDNKVKVNGKIINQPGLIVSEDDKVEIDGKVLELDDKFYIKLYKPVGYITSNYDPYNDKDLNDLIDLNQRFFAAGRLDKDSEGLLIITNDGEFTNNIIHPKFELDKEYIVNVSKKLTKTEIIEFEKGIDIGLDEHTSNSQINLIDNNTYRVIIHQGYNRQIRRMFAYFSSDVLNLKRIRIGDIKLGNLYEKEFRYFNEKEMKFVEKVKR